jgi:hypothetical protein
MDRGARCQSPTAAPSAAPGTRFRIMTMRALQTKP